MKSKFLDYLDLAKLMLSKLNDHTLRAKDWMDLCYRAFHANVEFNYVKFYKMLPSLMKQGYIERISRGVYRATEKGKKQLELWKNEENKN